MRDINNSSDGKNKNSLSDEYNVTHDIYNQNMYNQGEQQNQSNMQNGYSYSQQSGYNQYNPNQHVYNQDAQIQQNKSNKGLIVAISILAAVIVLGIALIGFMLTGFVSFSSGSQEHESTSVVAIEPTQSPAPIAPAPVVPESNTTIVSYKYVANVKNSIYLRSEAVENDSNIITEIPLGAQVGYIESANSNFAKINYNGIIGYAKHIYLSDTMPYIPSTNTTVSHYVYVTNVKNSIYFRSAPAESSGNIITEIPLGTQVGFIENVDSVFAKIYYNGQIGYAKQIYLSSYQPNTYSEPRSSTMTVVNVKNSIYLRSSASESSDANIIMEIPVGSKVTYLGTPNSTFYKISYGGTVGYSKQIYLSFD